MSGTVSETTDIEPLERKPVKGDYKLLAQDLPPFEERKCVVHGLCRRGPSGLGEYEWPKLKTLYFMGTSDSIMDFCLEWHIPYKAAVKYLKPHEKSELARMQRLDWRAAVARAATISNLREVEAEGQRLRKILEDLSSVAEAGASYARARLMKFKDGRQVVNAALDPREVRALTDISKNAAETLRVAFEITRFAIGTGPQVGDEEPVPTPVME